METENSEERKQHSFSAAETFLKSLATPGASNPNIDMAVKDLRNNDPTRVRALLVERLDKIAGAVEDDTIRGDDEGNPNREYGELHNLIDELDQIYPEKK